MKKVFLISLMILAISAISLPISRNVETKRELTRKEMFHLELQTCREAMAAGKPDKCRLYGKIKWVTSFPDVKVKVVNSFPDIKVKLVSSFPDGPGKWQIVNSFPDYKVQKVSSFPDYKIKFVNSFPGCR